jgi:hypothetical protein
MFRTLVVRLQGVYNLPLILMSDKLVCLSGIDEFYIFHSVHYNSFIKIQANNR